MKVYPFLCRNACGRTCTKRDGRCLPCAARARQQNQRGVPHPQRKPRELRWPQSGCRSFANRMRKQYGEAYGPK